MSLIRATLVSVLWIGNRPRPARAESGRRGLGIEPRGPGGPRRRVNPDRNPDSRPASVRPGSR
ncbi:hypothetical protein [Lysobacter gummosus]|uniref:hypothetical protein n=1 Tax=Lysobacter gummosus TaxID=262324 RepID=UPI003637F0AB